MTDAKDGEKDELFSIIDRIIEGELCSVDSHLELLHWRDKSCKELRTRVEELEAEVESRKELSGRLHKYHPDILKLQTRLSTLLKASEGMEKALEELDKLGRCWIQHNVTGSAGFISGAAVCERTQPALADFRAVKEGEC